MADYLALKSMEENGGPVQGGGAAGGEEHFKQELLTAVKTGDEEKLRHALKHLPEKAVNHIFPLPDSTTVLHLAARNNSLNLVNVLLEAGADTNIKDMAGTKYSPLHYAVENGHGEVVTALLKNGANPNAKESSRGYTALHLLTTKWKDNESSYKDCLDALLACNKTRVDTMDENSRSPLYLAAVRGWKYMVEQLIKKGANINVGSSVKTAKDCINEKFPGLLDTIDFSNIEVQKRHFGDELNDALTNSNIDLFREILTEIESTEPKSMKSALEEDHGAYTMLQYACDRGMTEFVEELLKHGADPSQVNQTSQMSPVLYAARNGYYKILDLLLQDQKFVKTGLRQRDRRKETVLHKVVKKEYVAKDERVNYFSCLELLLDKKFSLDIDAQDEFGCTPLHYAVLCDDQNFVRILLLSGANLGVRNQFGTLAITRIQPTILEEVLNDCIKPNNKMSDRDFEIIVQYSVLAPTETSQQPETECLRFLSGSRKHKHLLRHPVIDTFLYLKWQRMQKYYCFNIAVYTLFLLLLTAYILLYHGSVTASMNTHSSGQNITQNITDEEMMQNKTAGYTKILEALRENHVLKIVLIVLISIGTLFLALREGIQFYISWKLYVLRLKNWLEISIIGLTCLVLFVPIEAVSHQGICAWLVLLSWIEFVLVLGRHPYFSIYIAMFTKVTKNFFKFIVMFSSMVFAFSLSFFLMFQVDENFDRYYKALLKTITMTTGEFEYADLPFDEFPWSSQLLYIAFVFLIVLVLMNLLNGLAVSDIQQIQQEAEILSYSSRVELIAYIESVFFTSPLHRIFPKSLRCCEEGDEKDSCSFSTCLESHNPVTRLLNHLGRHTSMFQTCLRKKRSITLYPNRGKEQRWYVCECHRLSLKDSHIEAAKDVVLEKEHAVSDHRLSGLEARLDQLMEAVSSLTQKVDRHVLLPSPQ